MTPEDVRTHFKSLSKTAAALGVSQSTVCYWLRIGRVPFVRQRAIELQTKGRLKAERRGK